MMSTKILITRPNKYVETHAQFLRRIAERYAYELEDEDIDKLERVASEIESDMR
jgi:hypothetical protein